MKTLPLRHCRVLGVSPSTRGFGFAVLEGEGTLADWGATEVKGDKNPGSLAKIERLMMHYEPDVLVLPDVRAKNCRRAPRIKTLCRHIADLAQKRELRMVTLSTEQVRHRCLGTKQGTKHGLALDLADRFPSELGSSLPPKRRPWTSEDRRMDIFDAVGLALAFRLKGQTRRQSPGLRSQNE